MGKSGADSVLGGAETGALADATPGGTAPSSTEPDALKLYRNPKDEERVLEFDEQAADIVEINEEDGVVIKTIENFVYAPAFFYDDVQASNQVLIDANGGKNWFKSLEDGDEHFHNKWPLPIFHPEAARSAEILFTLPQEYQTLKGFSEALEKHGHIDIRFKLGELLKGVCPSGSIFPLTIQLVEEMNTFLVPMDVRLITSPIHGNGPLIDWFVNRSGCSEGGNDLTVAHVAYPGINRIGRNKQVVLYKPPETFNSALFSRWAGVDHHEFHAKLKSAKQGMYCILRAPAVIDTAVQFDNIQHAVILNDWTRLQAISRKLLKDDPVVEQKDQLAYFKVAFDALEAVRAEYQQRVPVHKLAMKTDELILRVQPVDRRGGHGKNMIKQAFDSLKNYIPGHSPWAPHLKPSYTLKIKIFYVNHNPVCRPVADPLLADL